MTQEFGDMFIKLTSHRLAHIDLCTVSIRISWYAHVGVFVFLNSCVNNKFLNICVTNKFCVRNGAVPPKKEGLLKQTQVILLGELYSDDVAAWAYPLLVKLEPLLSRLSWTKVPQKYTVGGACSKTEIYFENAM
jgi:hypothetical protein